MRRDSGCFLSLRSDEHKKYKLVMVISPVSKSSLFIHSINIYRDSTMFLALYHMLEKQRCMSDSHCLNTNGGGQLVDIYMQPSIIGTMIYVCTRDRGDSRRKKSVLLGECVE